MLSCYFIIVNRLALMFL